MLEVNGKKFTEENTHNINIIIDEIMQLPEPKIVSCDSSPIVEENNTILCLQKEMAYIDLSDSSNFKSKITYLGTKELNECIFLYITNNKKEYIIIHADQLKLTLEIFKKFKSKENITVTLIGGVSGEDNHKIVSKNNLDHVVDALLAAAAKFNISIKIINQKLLQNNCGTENSRYQTVYDYFYEKIDILYRQIFNEDLPNDFLADCKTKDFYTSKKPVHSELIPAMANISNAIIAVREFYDNELHSDLMLCQVKETFSNKDDFRDAMEHFFTPEGFDILVETIEKCRYKNNVPMLSNFVFDIQSQNIHVINRRMKTPDESFRFLHLMDADQYFVCYGGKTDGWEKSELTENSVRGLQRIRNKLDKDMINLDGSIRSHFKSLSENQLHTFVRHVKLALDELDRRKSNKSNKSDKATSTKSSIFQPDPAETAHNQLLIDINKIIPKGKYSNFTNAIKEKKYGQALRICCTAKDLNDSIPLELIKILIKYQNPLHININEQAGNQQKSALHHAAINKNIPIYEYLISQGADKTLKDVDGRTPEDYFEWEFGEKTAMCNI